MPAFMFGGRHLVSVRAWKQHLGVYPVHSVPKPLERENDRYR